MTVRISLSLRGPGRRRRPPLKGAQNVARLVYRALWFDRNDARAAGLPWGEIMALVRRGTIKAVRWKNRYLVLRLSVERAQRKGLIECKKRDLSRLDRMLLGEPNVPLTR